MKANNALLTAIVTLAATAGLASAATISNTSIAGDASKLTICYTTDEDAFVTGDVLIDDESVGASLGNFVGTINEKVSAGAHTAYWFPKTSVPDREIAANALKVRLTVRKLSDPPPYLVHGISLAQPRLKYYDSTNAIPGGITSDRYKLDYIVLRRIPAQGKCWKMDNLRWITMTHDFWMGVYPVTQRQYSIVRGANGVPLQFVDAEDSALRPVNKIARVNLDGWQLFNNGGKGYDHWYEGYEDCKHPFFGAWRKIFPDNTPPYGPPMDFYLPTEAQWAYACQNGGSIPAEEFDDYVWHSGNSGGKTHPVGLKKPNGFGLYDLQGNVAECTLDGWKPNLPDTDATEETCYVKPTDRENYVTYRGGSWADGADSCLSSSRCGKVYHETDERFGFRICSTIFTTTESNTKVDYDLTFADALDTRVLTVEPETMEAFDSTCRVQESSNSATISGFRMGCILIVR